MPVVKHLYALTHGSTYCTCGVLTVTLPVGVCALICWTVTWGYAGAMGGGYVSMYGQLHRSGFVVWGVFVLLMFHDRYTAVPTLLFEIFFFTFTMFFSTTTKF